MTSFKDLFKDSSGGSVSAFSRDSQIGATVTGPIVSVAVRQWSDPATQALGFWDDGKPKEQVIVTLQTTQRDPSMQDDDGTRSVYIKWWGVQRQALIQALHNAGADDIEVGGQFTATYTGDGPRPENRAINAAKLYSYTYKAPSAAAGLIQQATSQQQAPAQTQTVANPVTSGFTVQPEQFAQQQPAQQAATAPAGADDMGAKVQRVRELGAASVPAGVIASLVGLDAATVAAVLAA